MALLAYLQMAIFHPLDLLMRGRIRQRYYSSTALADTPVGQENGGKGEGGEVRVEPLEGPAAAEDPAAKRHLVVLVNGLFGSVDNWDVVVECLQERLGPEAKRELLIAASKANSRRQTYQGIDKCGRRLVKEIEALKQAHPNLQRISFIGHSMGGLIARHAAGHLFDKRTGLIAGLKPAHFITMATPHLGCETGASPAQVPFIHWFGTMPRVQGVVMTAAPVVTPYLFGRAGRQFFLGDVPDDGEAEPLIVRMSRDVEGEAAYLSALKAFRSRTAYANSGGDHLVGWANASLRHLQQLPAIPDAPGKGVFREDPVTAGMAPAIRSALDPATLERLRHGMSSASDPSGSLTGDPRSSSSTSDYESVTIQAADSRDSWHTAASGSSPSLDVNSTAISRSSDIAANGGGTAGSGGRSIAFVGNSGDAGRSGSPGGTVSGNSGGLAAADGLVQSPAAAVTAASPKEGTSRPAVVLQASSNLSRQAGDPARESSAGGAEPERTRSGCCGGCDGGAAPDGGGSGGTSKGDAAAAAAAIGGTDGPAIEAVSLSVEVEGMLRRLASLPWRRIDVSFTGTRMPYTAHNLIQVTRRWINFEGVAVPRHLADQVAALEALERGSRA